MAVAGVSFAVVVVVTLPEGTEHRESFKPLDRFLAGGSDSGVVIGVEFEEVFTLPHLFLVGSHWIPQFQWDSLSSQGPLKCPVLVPGITRINPSKSQ
jgi:hypothetical protein